MALKQLYINGTGSGTCGVYLNSDTYLDSPSIDYSEYQIPAVTGNQVAYNKRLNNVVRRFDCFINDNVETNLLKFKKLLYASNGYMRIESDYDTDTYQLGYLAQEIQVSPFRNREIKFSLYFSCMPQKWFKSNSTAQKTIGVSISDVNYVFPRTYIVENGKNLTTAFNQIPIDQRPLDEYYAYMLFSPSITTPGTITNVSITSDKDGFVAIMCVGLVHENRSELICYGYGSASKSSFTIPSYVDDHVSLIAVFSVNGSPTITATATHPDNTVMTETFDPANFGQEIANQDAFGVDLDMILTCKIDGGDSIHNSAVVISSSYLSEQQNEALYIVHFDEMDSDLITTLNTYFSRYQPSVLPTNIVDILIDSANNAYAVKETDMLDITSYLEVSGSINGKCDKISQTIYKGYNSIGEVAQATLKPRWWKL